MKNRTSIQYSFIAIGCLLLAGCGPKGTEETASNPASTPSSSAQPAGKPVEVAFVTNNASDYWTIARKGVEKAEKELGSSVKVDFQIPSDGQVAQQTQILNDLVSKGVQGIAVSPVRPADETSLLNETAKSAVVITQDSDAPKSNRTCYIGTDNVAAGRKAGDEIKKALPTGGKIMVFVGNKDAQNALERLGGIKEELKGSNITIVDVRTDETDHAKAKTNVADALVKYNDLGCLVGLWSYNGPAILNAVKEAGKQGKIKIVCFDEEDDTLTGVKDGFIQATVVQQPFEFGYRSIKKLVAIVRGDKSVIPANKIEYVDTKVITKDNVDEFIKTTNQLRGRS